jgi:hypothetical protein
MKTRTFIILITLLVAGSANAQELKKFRLGGGVGFGGGRGQDAEAGILIKVEPGYDLNNRILLNGRIESVFLKPGTTVEDLGTIDFHAVSSFTVSCQYYFKTGKTRPFVGVGIGEYILTSESDFSPRSSTYHPGIYQRAGFEFKNFSVCLDYNMVQKTSGVAGWYPNLPQYYNSYLSISVAVFFVGTYLE